MYGSCVSDLYIQSVWVVCLGPVHTECMVCVSRTCTYRVYGLCVCSCTYRVYGLCVWTCSCTYRVYGLCVSDLQLYIQSVWGVCLQLYIQSVWVVCLEPVHTECMGCVSRTCSCTYRVYGFVTQTCPHRCHGVFHSGVNKARGFTAAVESVASCL